MIIDEIRVERENSRSRLAARFTWEQRARAPLTVAFEVPERFDIDLPPIADPFLVLSVMPAMRHGEKRLACESDACPVLLDGLRTAASLVANWFGGRKVPPTMEVASRPAPRRASIGRTGAFLSGGLDSLALLLENRVRVPQTHPAYIRDGVFIYGFDIGGDGSRQSAEEARRAFDRALEGLKEVATADGNLELLPVWTNLREIEPDWPFWIFEFHGAALASVAHALGNRVDCVHVASSRDVSILEPFGSHPLLDSLYCSQELSIRHVGLTSSRLDKARLIARWKPALDNLRVCARPPAGQLNCGICEKCVRTRVALLAAGALSESAAFPNRDVEVDELDAIVPERGSNASSFRECREPLLAMGRSDIVQALDRLLERHDRAGDRDGLLGYRTQEFDRSYVKESPGALLRMLCRVPGHKLRKLRRRLASLQ